MRSRVRACGNCAARTALTQAGSLRRRLAEAVLVALRKATEVGEAAIERNARDAYVGGRRKNDFASAFQSNLPQIVSGSAPSAASSGRAAGSIRNTSCSESGESFALNDSPGARTTPCPSLTSMVRRRYAGTVAGNGTGIWKPRIDGPILVRQGQFLGTLRARPLPLRQSQFPTCRRPRRPGL